MSQPQGQQPGIVEVLLQELAALCGYDLKPKDNNLEWSDVFWYQFPRVTNLTHGTTSSPVTIQIQNDSDFEWQGSMIHFDLTQAAFTNATAPLPNMSVTIVETGSGKQLMNSAVPVMNIFGIAEAMGPIWLPQPKILTRNSVIQASIANFDAANDAGDLWMTFVGRKLYNANVAR